MMQNFTVDQCGPVHITMGDGGNIEGVCKCLALLQCICPWKLSYVVVQVSCTSNFLIMVLLP